MDGRGDRASSLMAGTRKPPEGAVVPPARDRLSRAPLELGAGIPASCCTANSLRAVALANGLKKLLNPFRRF